MKKVVIASIAILLAFTSNGRITHYSPEDNPFGPVYRVDDMDGTEIKAYNRLISDSCDNDFALYYINTARAMTNLEYSPKTIIDCWAVDFRDNNKKTGKNVYVDVINNTHVTIREITLKIGFKRNNGSVAYDTNTGNQYLILTFRDLKGKTNKLSSCLECYHSLNAIDDAVNGKLFYNENIYEIYLQSVKIVYKNGKTTNNAALFYGYEGEDLYRNGPLSPIVNYIHETEKKKENERRKDANEKDDDIYNQSNRMDDEDTWGKFKVKVVIDVPPPPKLKEKQPSTQNKHKNAHSNSTSTKVRKDANEKGDDIYKAVEQMPEYPGGQAALLKWVSSHINYPAMAAENNVQGKVTVQFVVKKDGSIGEVKVVRSVDKDLDREAIRLIKELPNFYPGRQNGQPVDVWYTLPVNFKLQGTN